jgi:hypothetical protein
MIIFNWKCRNSVGSEELYSSHFSPLLNNFRSAKVVLVRLPDVKKVYIIASSKDSITIGIEISHR